MTNKMQLTGEVIKFENGRKFSISKKMTKSGVRFYYWASGRYLPISKDRINQYIFLND